MFPPSHYGAANINMERAEASWDYLELDGLSHFAPLFLLILRRCQPFWSVFYLSPSCFAPLHCLAKTLTYRQLRAALALA